MLQVNLNNYFLGNSFCRQKLTSISLKNNIKFSQRELMQFCKEQDVEWYAAQLNTKLSKLCFIAIYRAPSDMFF
jgi:hypothetical protein